MEYPGAENGEGEQKKALTHHLNQHSIRGIQLVI
jgi:hypothetical protein